MVPTSRHRYAGSSRFGPSLLQLGLVPRLALAAAPVALVWLVIAWALA